MRTANRGDRAARQGAARPCPAPTARGVRHPACDRTLKPARVLRRHHRARQRRSHHAACHRPARAATAPGRPGKTESARAARPGGAQRRKGAWEQSSRKLHVLCMFSFFPIRNSPFAQKQRAARNADGPCPKPEIRPIRRHRPAPESPAVAQRNREAHQDRPHGPPPVQARHGSCGNHKGNRTAVRSHPRPATPGSIPAAG